MGLRVFFFQQHKTKPPHMDSKWRRRGHEITNSSIAWSSFFFFPVFFFFNCFCCLLVEPSDQTITATITGNSWCPHSTHHWQLTIIICFFPFFIFSAFVARCQLFSKLHQFLVRFSPVIRLSPIMVVWQDYCLPITITVLSFSLNRLV